MTVHFNSATGKLMFPWEFIGVSGKNYITNRGKVVPRINLTPRFVKGADPFHRKAGETPALDLDFASNKSLTDTVSGKNLVTFTRASNGTFVGADGLIKTASVNFALNSNSVQGSTLGTPIINSTESVVSPRGINETVRRLGRSAQEQAQVWRVGSTSGGTPDTTYTISFFAKTVSGGTTNINIDINDAAPFSGQEATITGEWTRIVKTGGSRPNNLRFFDMNMRSDTTEEFYVWGAQIEEGITVTDYISTGSTISGAPRFDHDPLTGESLGLLIEEARTNEIVTDIGLTSNLTGASVSEDNSVTKPDGTTGALKITATAGSSVHSAQRTSGQTTTNHTFSIFVKKGNHRYIGLSQGGTGNNIHVIFDTDTKTFVDEGTHNNATFVSSGFEEYANGWFRIHMVGFTQGTTLRVFLAGSASQNGLRNWNATGNEFCYAWGIQREDGSFPTSYIPTSGIPVTRAADIGDITGTNFSDFYRQSEGTFFGDVTGPTGFGFVAHNGSNTERHGFGPVQGTTFSVISGVPTDFGVTPTVVKGGGKFAHGYKANDYGAFGDGVNLPETSPTGVPIGVNQLALGYRGSFQADAFLNGHIKRLAYFRVRLPDATLQNITA